MINQLEMSLEINDKKMFQPDHLNDEQVQGIHFQIEYSEIFHIVFL